jgi:hypothetical protein
MQKDEKRRNGLEKRVYKLYEDKELSWFPILATQLIQEKQEANQLVQKLDSLEEKIDQLAKFVHSKFN